MNTDAFDAFETKSMYGTTTYRVKQLAPECYVCEFVSYAPFVPPTPEEAAEQVYEAEMYQHYLEQHEGDTPDMYYPHGHWRTPEAAKRACMLFEAIEAAAEDACEPMQRALEKLADEFLVPAPPRTYRAPTIAETLPNGGVGMSDDDIIAALGEKGLSFVRPIDR